MEQIIDHLCNDKRTLAACKLAQRAWVPRARTHLHRTLVLRRGGLDPYKLRFYLPVAHCIRAVTVAPILLRELASSPLVEIDKVEHLQVTSFGEPQGPVVRASEFPRFSRLKTLALLCHCLRSPLDLFAVLAEAPCLDKLVVDLRQRHSAITGRPFLDAVARCNRLRLQTLEIAFHLNVNVDPGILPQIVLGLAGATLKHLTLDLRYFLPASVDEICTFTRHILAYTCPEQFLSVRTLSMLDFSHNVSLESLHVCFGWIPMLWASRTAQHAREIRLANAFLSHLFSPHLREISFQIHLGADRHTLTTQLRHLHLRWLDSLINPVLDPLLPQQRAEEILKMAQGLRVFKIMLSLACHPSAHELARIRAHALSQIPILTERGILQFIVGH